MSKTNDRRGNSIIEVMVVIVILTTGIIGTYNILNSGERLAATSENRIKAINIAREGIEAVENIRDTNWLKYSSDYANCWRVKDYDPTCIGNVSPSIFSGSYILSNSGGLWFLSGAGSPLSYAWGYRDQFPIYVDSGGLFAPSGNNALCGLTRNVNCKSIFTREIRISYPDNDHMKVDSIVKWVDNSRRWDPYTIDLDLTLTNWKKNF